MENQNFQVGDTVKITEKPKGMGHYIMNSPLTFRSLYDINFVIHCIYKGPNGFIAALYAEDYPSTHYFCPFDKLILVEKDAQIIPDSLSDKLTELTKTGQLKWDTEPYGAHGTRYFCEVGDYYFEISSSHGKTINSNKKFICKYRDQNIDVPTFDKTRLFSLIKGYYNLQQHKTVIEVMDELNKL